VLVQIGLTDLRARRALFRCWRSARTSLVVFTVPKPSRFSILALYRDIRPLPCVGEDGQMTTTASPTGADRHAMCNTLTEGVNQIECELSHLCLRFSFLFAKNSPFQEVKTPTPDRRAPEPIYRKDFGLTEILPLFIQLICKFKPGCIKACLAWSAVKNHPFVCDGEAREHGSGRCSRPGPRRILGEE
jgi:hypothetical protein